MGNTALELPAQRAAEGVLDEFFGLLQPDQIRAIVDARIRVERGDAEPATDGQSRWFHTWWDAVVERARPMPILARLEQLARQEAAGAESTLLAGTESVRVVLEGVEGRLAGDES